MPEFPPPHPGYLTAVFKGSPENLTAVVEMIRSDSVPAEITAMAHSNEMTRLNVIEQITEDRDLDVYDAMDAIKEILNSENPEKAYATWKTDTGSTT